MFQINLKTCLIQGWPVYQKCLHMLVNTVSVTDGQTNRQMISMHKLMKVGHTTAAKKKRTDKERNKRKWDKRSRQENKTWGVERE